MSTSDWEPESIRGGLRTGIGLGEQVWLVSSDSDPSENESALAELGFYSIDDVNLDQGNESSPTARSNSTTDELKTEKPDGSAETKNDLERKRKSGYKTSLKFIRKLSARDPDSLTPRERKLQKKHVYNIRKYESSVGLDSTFNATTIQARPSSPELNEAPEIPKHETLEPITAPNQVDQPQAVCIDQQPSTSKGTVSDNGAAVGNRNKRQQSGDTTRSSECKRQKPIASLSSPPELQVAIIDRQHPNGKMKNENWLILEEKIMRALLEAMTQAPSDTAIGLFNGTRWHKGVKVVGCGNAEALRFLTECVRSQGELWPGADLDVVHLKDFLVRTTVRVWVPPPVLEDKAILSLIKLQNHEVKPEDWTIVQGRARDMGAGKDLWIHIGPESLQLLREREGVIRFGVGQLRLILPHTDENNS